MSNLYQEELLDHYHHPRNFGQLIGPQCRIVETNASCGDELTLAIKLGKKKGVLYVTDSKFTGSGCAVSVAATSLLTEHIKGKTVEELQAIDFDFMQRLIGTTVSPGRIKCLTLGARALMKLLNQALATAKK
jgi:nitrogen fixation NifU-like protein